MHRQSIMLTPQSCDLFQRPFFQFAQIRQYQPETEAQTKGDYKAAWQVWRTLVLQVTSQLGAGFAPPHIERWCNGWQRDLASRNPAPPAASVRSLPQCAAVSGSKLPPSAVKAT